MRTITRAELQQLRNTREKGPVLVNVLPESHFEKEHIPGSLSAPWEQDGFEQRVEQLAGGKQAPIVTYCASTTCTASERAAKKLEQAGFSNVADYEGGVADWIDAGLPIAHGGISK